MSDLILLLAIIFAALVYDFFNGFNGKGMAHFVHGCSIKHDKKCFADFFRFFLFEFRIFHFLAHGLTISTFFGTPGAHF